MQISKLRIKNFRSIKDSQDIELTKLYALIGKNNTGKSAVLKAIQLFWGKLKIEKSDFHKGINKNIEIEISLKNYNDKEKYQELFLDKDKKEKAEIKLKLIISPDLEEKLFLCEGVEEKEEKLTIIKKLPPLLIIPDIRNPEKESTAGSKSFLRELINTIESQGKFEREKQESITKIQEIIEKDLQTISQITTQKFQSILENKWEISINSEVDITKAIFYDTDLITDNNTTAKLLSSGTGIQSVFILALLEAYAEVVKSNDSILLIEEPEVYLHPELQRRMFAALRRIAENNQVVYSTHSPIMISEVWATESIRQITLNERGETLINAIKIEEVIDELGIRYEDILNPKLVLFVEGEHDISFFKAIGLDDSRLKMINSDGLRAVHYYAYIKIITSEFVTNEFRIIVDSDGMDVSDRKNEVKEEIEKQYRRKINIKSGNLEDKIIVLSEYAIESYFLQENILSKSFPFLSEEDINKLIDSYRRKYDQEQVNLRDKKLELNKFQQFLKPKSIFENDRNQKNEQEYLDFWANEKDFLESRNLILKECQQLEKDGKDPFTNILENITIQDLPQELVTQRDEILELLKK